jgi:hypothetical protein
MRLQLSVEATFKISLQHLLESGVNVAIVEGHSSLSPNLASMEKLDNDLSETIAVVGWGIVSGPEKLPLYYVNFVMHVTCPIKVVHRLS